MKKCTKCGKETDSLYHDEYCSDCYGVIWDRGFSVTTQWGEDIAHREFVRDLNDAFKDDNTEFENLIKIIMNDFNYGDWFCSSCGKTIIPVEKQTDFTLDQITDLLHRPCEKCSAVGQIGHSYVP